MPPYNLLQFSKHTMHLPASVKLAIKICSQIRWRNLHLATCRMYLKIAVATLQKKVTKGWLTLPKNKILLYIFRLHKFYATHLAIFPLRIQACPNGLHLEFYSGDGIGFLGFTPSAIPFAPARWRHLLPNWCLVGGRKPWHHPRFGRGKLLVQGFFC